MARISSYDLDTSVSKTDKVIGTDSSGNTTKNFNMGDVANFLNTSSLINVNGQVVYKLTGNNSPAAGEFSKTGSSNNFSAMASFNFSHTNTNNQNIETYLNYFDGLRVVLTQTDDQNNFGLYNVDSITNTGEGATFSTLTVTFIEGNGAMQENKFYAMAYSPKGQTDKHYEESVAFNNSTTPPFTRTINHNLSKFPSVTVVDSGGSRVIGEVNHIDKNSFTITFKDTFSAKVYAN